MSSDIAVIRQLIHWERAGGEARAGLPTDSFDELTRNAVALRSALLSLSNNVGDALTFWDVLGRNGSTSVQTVLSRLVSELGTADSDSAAAQTISSAVYADATSLLSLVRSYRKADERAINKASNDIEAARITVITSKALLAGARAELEGGQGFLNGFITAVTLTAVNPVQQNIDAANAAIRNGNAALHRARALHQKRAAHQREKAETERILGSLLRARDVVTDLRNAVHSAQLNVRAALTTLGPAEEIDDAFVKNILIEKAGPAMADLRTRAQWLQLV